MLAATVSIGRLETRRMRDSDVNEICLWVRTRSEMALVASELDDALTPEVLAKWKSRSLYTVVVYAADAEDRPLGFCTISLAESDGLPADHVELCHLIVNPSARYGGVAFRLIDAVRKIAADLGYKRVVGRVVPTNTRMLVVAGFKGCQRYKDIPNWAADGFAWLHVAAGEDSQKRQRLL